MATPRILIIDDEPTVAESCAATLERAGYKVTVENTAEGASARVRSEAFDLVLTDLHLTGSLSTPPKEGFHLIQELRAQHPDIPIILMTGDRDTNRTIEATKLGALDFIAKPFEREELVNVVGGALSAARPVAEPVELGGVAPARDVFVGHSRTMREVYKAIGRVATTSTTVLVRGETGTGKELVARAIHRHSDRVSQPFLAVNCAAIPETLLESELFGHERGAFTSADRRHIGFFEQADRGTLLLDEIGDMSLSTQAKLLRVLQDRSVRRLGSNEAIAVNTRVIAATHRNLEAAIANQKFRQDLYYRLNVAVIDLPPLRERKEDIPDLVQFFIRRHSEELSLSPPSVAADAITSLQEYHWPGNVRELENAICKALLLARGHPIRSETVHAALGKVPPESPSPSRDIARYIAELLEQAVTGDVENVEAVLERNLERELYAQAILRAKGNQGLAAKWLGVSRPTMREKLKLYGLHPGLSRDG